MSRAKFLCQDCNVDTDKIGEHYMLINEVWSQVMNSPKGMFCITCFEKRLGRQLTSKDFNNSHINKLYPGKIFSLKLLNRLGV